MNVTAITYRRLRSYGDYSNASLEATASVVEGETPEQAIDALRTLVETTLERQIAADKASDRLETLNAQIEYAKTELAELKAMERQTREEVLALRQARRELTPPVEVLPSRQFVEEQLDEGYEEDGPADEDPDDLMDRLNYPEQDEPLF